VGSLRIQLEHQSCGDPDAKPLVISVASKEQPKQREEEMAGGLLPLGARGRSDRGKSTQRTSNGVRVTETDSAEQTCTPAKRARPGSRDNADQDGRTACHAQDWANVGDL